MLSPISTPSNRPRSASRPRSGERLSQILFSLNSRSDGSVASTTGNSFDNTGCPVARGTEFRDDRKQRTSAYRVAMPPDGVERLQSQRVLLLCEQGAANPLCVEQFLDLGSSFHVRYEKKKKKTPGTRRARN